MNEIDIVCAADERFAMPLAVTLRSAAENCSRPVRAFILNTDLSDRTRWQIKTACAQGRNPPVIRWVDTDQDYFRDAPLGLQHLSQAAYLRLAMGRKLPADVNRIIYLDSDVLVLKDLAAFWDEPLGENIMGAVRDFTTPLAGNPGALGPCLGQTGITASDPVFNSGVLLIDLNKYRDLNVEAECIAFVEKWKQVIRSADQGALNAVVYGRWKRLDFAWNLQMSSWHDFKSDPSLNADEKTSLQNVDPAILHFSGAWKPWNSGLRSAYCTAYLEHVNATGWYGKTGFQFWKAKRFAKCIRTIAVNKFDSLKAGRNPQASVERSA